MRLVSWNVFWRFGPQWRDRQAGILATLRALDADVIGLQESWIGDDESQAEVLAEELGMFWVVAEPSLPPVPEPPHEPDQDGIRLGVGLLSRWPIGSVREHRLPARHRFQPVALMAALAHPAGPLHTVVSCVEWEPSFADDHREQTRALAELLVDPVLDGDLPVLLLADLNAGPGSLELRPLLDVMTDPWSVVGADPDAATLSRRNPLAPLAATKQLDRRIDYVLARPGTPQRPVQVDRAFTIDTPIDGLPPSDHYPVVVDLDLA
jgi:endonuclease/exonuclease/phosphatase family metal-dependent hydrolase